MAELIAGTEVVTESATFTITQNLPPGRYRYQLIVEDDRGLRSDPVVIVVQVVAPPVAVLEVRPGTTLRSNADFVLDGSKSTDTGGKITRYHWTLLPPGRDS